jgi:hypothetical protein
MHESTKGKVKRLVDELKQLYEERLVSVCVYGSSVFSDADTGKPGPHTPDINVTVILTDITATDLEKASSVSKWWETVGHCLPVFFSEAEWLRSADVFALEYADIRDNHHLVYGKDLFSTTRIEPDALRLVCELELHRKLIFLRQRLLVYRDKPKVLQDLLEGSINNLAALFRGVLRLRSTADLVPMSSDTVFHELAKSIEGFDPKPFVTLNAKKLGGGKVSSHDVLNLYAVVVQQLGLVTAYVDQCYGFIVPKEGVTR